MSSEQSIHQQVRYCQWCQLIKIVKAKYVTKGEVNLKKRRNKMFITMNNQIKEQAN